MNEESVSSKIYLHLTAPDRLNELFLICKINIALLKFNASGNEARENMEIYGFI